MIGCERFNVFYSFERAWLPDGDTMCERGLLDRGVDNFFPPSRRLIDARNHGGNFVTLWKNQPWSGSRDERLQGGYRKLWCTHVNDAYHGPFPPSRTTWFGASYHKH